MEISPEDREKADTAYRAVFEIAKAEFDMLEPQLTKLQNRISLLRMLIRALSGLLGAGVEDKYMFKLPPSITRHSTAGMHKSGHR